MHVPFATTIGFKTNGRDHRTVKSGVPLLYHPFKFHPAGMLEVRQILAPSYMTLT